MRYVVTAGEIYGKLTVVSETRQVMPGGTIRRAVECRCDCGTVTTVEIRDLKARHNTFVRVPITGKVSRTRPGQGKAHHPARG